MKRTTFIRTTLLFFIIVGITSCDNQLSNNYKKVKDDKTGFVLQFESDKYNFGVIDATKKENEFISKEFIFKNQNDKPILITKADVSCGCISTKIPDKPIKSGEVGIVVVTLDTKQVNGNFSRTVFVRANTENDVELLKVIGEVKK